MKKITIILILIFVYGCQSETNMKASLYENAIKTDATNSKKNEVENKKYDTRDSITRRSINKNESVNSNRIIMPLNLKDLPDSIRNEQEIRIKRLMYLTKKLNAPLADTNEELQIATGSIIGINYPVPVIKIRYAEKTFFESNKSNINPESKQILDVIAEQMKGDLPDTSLVILGHTDSVGTDEYNNKLSIQRATVVMRELTERGVNTEQMSTVGIGESQPIATNSNDKGRSLNRRVEFLMSRYEDANFIAIEKFPRNIEWLNDNKTDSSTLKNTMSKSLNVLKLHKSVTLTANNEKNIKTEKEKIELIPIENSTRIVNLIPAEKVVVELLPGSY